MYTDNKEDMTISRAQDIPAASSKASSLACVSGSTVLRSAPSAVPDKSNLEAVSSIGFSKSSWSKMKDSTWKTNTEKEVRKEGRRTKIKIQRGENIFNIITNEKYDSNTK